MCHIYVFINYIHVYLDLSYVSYTLYKHKYLFWIQSINFSWGAPFCILQVHLPTLPTIFSMVFIDLQSLPTIRENTLIIICVFQKNMYFLYKPVFVLVFF